MSMELEASYQDIEKEEQRLIVVVCWGNIERSAVAEYFINKKLGKEGVAGAFTCESRGIQGSAGVPQAAFPNLTFYGDVFTAAKPSLDRYAIDFSSHISRPITAEIVQRASVILAMEEKVMSDENAGLLTQFPEAQGKIALFSSLHDAAGDFHDPAGSTDEDIHRKLIDDIARTVENGFSSLLNLAARSG